MGISSWLVPFGNQFTDHTKHKNNSAKLTSLNINPYLEIGKKFSDQRIGLFVIYSPVFHFLTPPDYLLNEISNPEEFYFPKNFFVEHKLGVIFMIDYITLLETNLIRKGFMLKGQAGKKRVDIFLVPRAVAYEKRIKACIVSPGYYDLHDAFLGALNLANEKMFNWLDELF